jgi:hypothetical protein
MRGRRSPIARKYFDQGLRLVYAFNHDEAIRAFQAAQKLDPSCAMCFWGEALALGPNINLPMDPSAEKPAGNFVLSSADLYRVSCRACHKPDGSGVPPQIS